MRWAEDRIGSERIKGAYAWNTMLKNGVRLAFWTDYNVEPISPFRGLYACVTRERPEGGPRKGWEAQEKISLEDCIRAYTSGSAYAQFEEGKKGELKLGEYADFLILSDDLTKSRHRNTPKSGCSAPWWAAGPFIKPTERLLVYLQPATQRIEVLELP